jgi:Ca-activated chloride channel family protein
MDFLKPTYLYLLLLIPLLLLLYVLKLRRKTHVVSSCLLWEQAIEDMKANTLFQRLRRNLLLPLQVIFLTLAVFALARPFLRGTTSMAQNIILIMDCSASMKSTDVGGTRFEAAKSDAAKLLAELGSGDRVMIIEARSSPRIAFGFSSDRLQLQDALDKMQPADTSSDLNGAIQLASSIVRDMQKSEIIILSDGAGMDRQQHALGDASGRVRFVRFGRENAGNVGITALEMGQSYADPSERQLFVALKNFSDVEKRPLLLELYHNEDLVDVRELGLSPGEKRSVVFDGLRYTDGIIEVAIDIDDYLKVDNHAYYVITRPGLRRVLLVSTGNVFLEEAIRTSSAEVEISREDPDSYSPDERYDLIVFDGFIPDELPRKNLIFVNPQGDLPFGKLIGRSDNPSIIDWDRSHPVMRFVELSGLRVARGYNYQMPPWMMPLVESDTTTLVWLGEHDGQRLMVLPFDVRPGTSSNFSVLPAFPIFFSNALSWLAETDIYHRQLRPGEPLKFSLPGAATDQAVTVRKTDGKEVSLQLETDNVVFSDTDRVGVYEIAGKGFAEAFAVNLLDESESDIRPADKIEIAGQEIASSTIYEVSNREIWGIVVLAALMILAVEWWVYHRRILV